MSSNPFKAPVSNLSDVDQRPVASIRVTEDLSTMYKKWRQADSLSSAFAALDMERKNGVVIPPETSVDPYYRFSAERKLAVTQSGPLQARPFSEMGRRNFVAAYDKLPEVAPFGTKASVTAKVQTRCLLGGGTQMSMGRLLKAYPRKGSVIRAPPSTAEVAQAIRSSGLDLGEMRPRFYPLNPEETEMRVNMHSDNGFPVGKTLADPEASGLAMGFAAGLLQRFERAAESLNNVRAGVARVSSELEETEPHMVLFKGKTKEDYYAVEKGLAFCLRFYNVCPRQLMLIMQMSTQPLEALSRNVLDDYRLHSAQGVSLARGGAEALVAALDKQLAEDDVAYVHVGDDSWVVVRVGGVLVQFALDCSNYDLTQHALTTEPVHEAIAQELAKVHRVSAAVWLRYMRERLTLLSGAQVFKLKHAGPSGMPAQSKVNDVLMDVVLQRVVAAKCRWTDADSVDTALARIGSDLGLSIRVEQHSVTGAATLREALEQQPFLFIGYYMYAEDGAVMPYADVDRTLSQRAYPTTKWVKSKEELLVREAVRLGALVVSGGIPPHYHRPSYEAARAHAVAVLERALALHGSVQHPRLAWVVGQEVAGPAVDPSVEGLLTLLRDDRRLRAIWEMEPELPSTSRLVALSWADEAELEDDEYRPPAGQAVKPKHGPKMPVRAPVTAANAGRFPKSVPSALRTVTAAPPLREVARRAQGKGKRQLTLLDF